MEGKETLFYKNSLILLAIITLLLSGCVRTATVGATTSFIVTPTTTGNCVWDNEENFSLLIMTNDSELVNWTDTYITFEIQPNVPDGVTRDDYTTVYFEVKDFDRQIFKFNGAYQIRWEEGDSLWYEKGSITMRYLDKRNLTLDFRFNLYQIALITSSSLTINFHNTDRTWNKEYNMQFTAVDVGE